MNRKTILLVEDDYLDVISVQRTLNKLNAEHDLYVAHNGVEALEYLNGSERREKILPDIILLDLNMPKMSGLEFLGIIKNYYSLKNIRIFVMTTSAEEYDIVATQQLGAAGYIIKPLNFDNAEKGKQSASIMELKKELLTSNNDLFTAQEGIPEGNTLRLSPLDGVFKKHKKVLENFDIRLLINIFGYKSKIQL